MRNRFIVRIRLPWALMGVVLLVFVASVAPPVRAGGDVRDRSQGKPVVVGTPRNHRTSSSSVAPPGLDIPAPPGGNAGGSAAHVAPGGAGSAGGPPAGVTGTVGRAWVPSDLMTGAPAPMRVTDGTLHLRPSPPGGDTPRDSGPGTPPAGEPSTDAPPPGGLGPDAGVPRPFPGGPGTGDSPATGVTQESIQITTPTRYPAFPPGAGAGDFAGSGASSSGAATAGTVGGSGAVGPPAGSGTATRLSGSGVSGASTGAAGTVASTAASTSSAGVTQRRAALLTRTRAASTTLADHMGRGRVKVSFTGLGAIAAEMVTVRITNTSSASITFTLTPGVVLGAPTGSRIQSVLNEQEVTLEIAPGETASHALVGYCLDYRASPPPKGASIAYTFGGDLSRYAMAIVVLDTASRLDAEGRFTAVLPPLQHRRIVTQRAVWAALGQVSASTEADKLALRDEIKLELKRGGKALATKELNLLTDSVWIDLRLTLEASGLP